MQFFDFAPFGHDGVLEFDAKVVLAQLLAVSFNRGALVVVENVVESRWRLLVQAQLHICFCLLKVLSFRANLFKLAER